MMCENYIVVLSLTCLPVFACVLNLYVGFLWVFLLFLSIYSLLLCVSSFSPVLFGLPSDSTPLSRGGGGNL